MPTFLSPTTVVDDLDDRRPWERREDETDAQWQGFKIYRDLGLSRTGEDAWTKYADARDLRSERAPSHWWTWKAENDWSERAAAWDRYQDRQHQAEVLDARREAMGHLLKGASQAALILRAIATGSEGKLSDELQDQLDSIERDRRIYAIREVLDRIGVDSPDELEISMDASVDAEQSVEHGLDDDLLDDLLDDLDDEELAVAEKIFGRLLDE